MQRIFVDEAGTSENEPVTVVVGLIVRNEHQHFQVEQRLAATLELVPVRYRSGFVSHATDIWNNHSYREHWCLNQRLKFLTQLSGIPAALGVPLSFAFVRRSNPVGDGDARSLQHHRYAFGMCIAHADRYIANFGTKDETLSIVAEDVPDRRRHLSSIAAHLSSEPFTHPSLQMFQMAVRQDGERIETALGPGQYRISRTRPPIRFLPKAQSPFLQIADACAFSLRRFLAGLKGGDQLLTGISSMLTLTDRDRMIRSMLGSQILSQEYESDIVRVFRQETSGAQ